MSTFKIDIYRQIRDEDFNPTEFEHVFYGTFESSNRVEKIVDELHSGEGIAIDMIKPQGEIPLIRLEFLGGQDEQDTIEWLRKEYSFVSEDNNDFENKIDSDTILSLCEIEFNEDESAELIAFLNTEFSEEFDTITKKIGIYEWGASGYFVDFILNLTAGFSQEGLERIFQFFRSKGHESVQINQYKIGNIKNFLSKNYGVNPNLLKLTSTRTYEKNQTSFTFSSRYADYIVKVDKKNIVIESNVIQLSQTNI